MAEKHTHGPVRIWATVNGRRTMFPSGETYLIGGWEERDLALHAVEYVRADVVGELVEALKRLVDAPALSGVREIVAGWNGEGKDDGPYERHPSRLGATLPKTTCGRVYELDEAMQAARAALSRATSDQPDTSTEPRP